MKIKPPLKVVAGDICYCTLLWGSLIPYVELTLGNLIGNEKIFVKMHPTTTKDKTSALIFFICNNLLIFRHSARE